MSIGFRVVETVNRPKYELIERFRDFSVANIADSMNDFFCLNPEIKLINENKQLKMLGSAITVKTLSTDNLLVNKAIDMAKPGDIIMIDASGHCSNALIGELLIQYGAKKGLAGYIVNGAVRDLANIYKLNIPVYAKGVNPQGPFKNGPGEINTTISCGGVVVRPGDIIMGDADGIIVVKPEEAETILKKAGQVKEKEVKVAEAIKNGKWDRDYIDKLLKEKDCHFQPLPSSDHIR